MASPRRIALFRVHAAQRLFLEGVRRSGTISAGAREASVSPKVADEWLASDPEFKQAYQDALADFKDSLEDRVLRAIDEDRDGLLLRMKLRGEMPAKYRR